MFRWMATFLRRPWQRFADGSQIRPLDRDSLEYLESDGHAMIIEAYITGRDSVDTVLIRESCGRWRPPHDLESVPENKQREVIEKVKRYFDDRKITYRIASDADERLPPTS